MFFLFCVTLTTVSCSDDDSEPSAYDRLQGTWEIYEVSTPGLPVKHGVWDGTCCTFVADSLVVYRTESGFDPAATSSVEARGLMQMTEETFIWLRSKIAPDEGMTFDELYDPDVSIRFGCYYIHLCMERYGGDVATAAAAYHSGWGTVDNLLRMEEHSSDGQTLKGFPYNQMHHYVEKITASYAVYTRLYGG